MARVDAEVTSAECEIDLAVTLDRRTVVMTSAADVLPPGSYRARRLRLYGVRIDADDGCMLGEPWFGLEYDGRLAWVRATECGPADV